MLQAEIGSAKVIAVNSLPTRGYLMPDFSLPSTEGKQVSLYDYRGRSNLALFFAGRPQDTAEENLLVTLAQHQHEIANADSEVIAILSASIAQAEQARESMHLPFQVLADSDLRVHNAVGALRAQGVPHPALYITDRFLEVYAGWRTAGGYLLPAVSEVLSWLTYLDSQCPECTQIEWPVDD